MTLGLTVGFGLVAGDVGPGFVITVTNPLVGPIPNDDVLVTSFQMSPGIGVITGQVFAHGLHVVSFPLGVQELPSGTPNFGTKGGYGTVPNGSPGYLQCDWRHADGTLQDNVITSVVWNADIFTHPYNVVTWTLALLLARLSGNTDSLTTLFGAVERNIQNAP